MNEKMQKLTEVFEEVVSKLTRRSDRIHYTVWLENFKKTLPVLEEHEEQSNENLFELTEGEDESD